MCSTTRGPAICPSLVTWPTRITAVPVVLAKRIRAWADERTCVTVPGADSTVSVHMVWIESMMVSAGGCPLRQRLDDVLDIGRAAAPPDIGRAPAARPAGAPARPPPRRRCRRRARRSWPWRRRPASAGSICRCRDRRPSRITEPRTKPPPVTRSSSLMPEAVRGRFLGLAGQPFEEKHPAPAPATDGSRRARIAGRRRRPPPGSCSSRCRLAAPAPAIVDRPAGLADEGLLDLGHGGSRRGRAGSPTHPPHPEVRVAASKEAPVRARSLEPSFEAQPSLRHLRTRGWVGEIDHST